MALSLPPPTSLSYLIFLSSPSLSSTYFHSLSLKNMCLWTWIQFPASHERELMIMGHALSPLCVSWLVQARAHTHTHAHIKKQFKGKYVCWTGGIIKKNVILTYVDVSKQCSPLMRPPGKEGEMWRQMRQRGLLENEYQHSLGRVPTGLGCLVPCLGLPVQSSTCWNILDHATKGSKNMQMKLGKRQMFGLIILKFFGVCTCVCVHLHVHIV